MRKVDPTDLCLDVKSEIANLRQFYLDSVRLINTETPTGKKLSLLSEIVFQQSYVIVESFLSAWFIGCINRDASVYLNFRENAILASVQDKYDARDRAWLIYSPPPHPSVGDLATLLDKEEKNITFKDYATMEDRAQMWLSANWANKISNTSVEMKANINASKAIRNCIAHRSQSSFSEMNRTLLNLPNTGSSALLRRDANAVSIIGAYLKTVQQGRTRVEIFLDEFEQFAGALQ